MVWCDLLSDYPWLVGRHRLGKQQILNSAVTPRGLAISSPNTLKLAARVIIWLTRSPFPCLSSIWPSRNFAPLYSTTHPGNPNSTQHNRPTNLTKPVTQTQRLEQKRIEHERQRELQKAQFEEQVSGDPFYSTSYPTLNRAPLAAQPSQPPSSPIRLQASVMVRAC